VLAQCRKPALFTPWLLNMALGTSREFKMYNINQGLWIRIRVGSGFNDFGSGSMGKKNEEKNALFLNFWNIFIAKRFYYVSVGSYFFDFILHSILRFFD
jgi:predicted secreted acid phosphatase